MHSGWTSGLLYLMMLISSTYCNFQGQNNVFSEQIALYCSKYACNKYMFQTILSRWYKGFWRQAQEYTQNKYVYKNTGLYPNKRGRVNLVDRHGTIPVIHNTVYRSGHIYNILIRGNGNQVCVIKQDSPGLIMNPVR